MRREPLTKCPVRLCRRELANERFSVSDPSNTNKTTVKTLLTVGLVMGVLAWAAVPAYKAFTRITGFAGTPSVAEEASEIVLEKTVEIFFDASLSRGMPWEVKPVERKMDIRIGETALAYYEAYNPTNRTIASSSSYNVSPESTGGYFKKVGCFCFETQVLKPGERILLPVRFYVGPEIVDDPDAKFAPRITLSYTFHEIDLSDEDLASLN